AACAAAAPTLGFVEDWPGTSLQGWAGAANSNPGTGGFGGAGDGYMLVVTGAPANLGANSMGPEYNGDWTAAGITRVRVWLNDVGTSQPLEIHFGLGRNVFDPSPNFWQYDVGMIPPAQAWGEYVVDLTSASWTRIQGSGTFPDAKQNV